MADSPQSQGSGAPVRQGATDLGLRVPSAIAMVAAALFTTYQGGWIFSALWLLAGIAMLFEWTTMTRCEPRLALRVTLSVILAGLSVLVFLAGRGVEWGVAACLVAGVAAVVLGRASHDRGWAAAGFAYAAVVVVVPPIVREHPRLGLVAILWMFAVVWASDIAAYFTGRRLGGPKLWPRISPKKTWTGFCGGLFAAVIAGALVVQVAERLGWISPAGVVGLVVASALASIVGQMGDLWESGLKRRFGVKDSGDLIPGHGGVMDRLDAFWAVSALVGLFLAGTQALGSGWAAGK